jgi:hypothetical protein
LVLRKGKIDKALAKVTKRKRKKTQTKAIRDEERAIITNTNDIQRIAILQKPRKSIRNG